MNFNDNKKTLKKGLIWLALTVLVVVVLAAVLAFNAIYRTHGRVMIEFDIHQNKDLIILSNIGEPPQFAIWLEDPVNGKLQTVFVTYRSGTGDWDGKLECPAALPRWFEVYQHETSTTELPKLDAPAPIAVTGATPEVDHFKIRAEVKPGSHWICWIEVNLAADFNADYQEYNETEGTIDTHLSGQPALIYRGEVQAVLGEQIEPQLYGQSKIENFAADSVEPVSSGVTTAKDIFKSIKIRVIKDYLCASFHFSICR